MTKNEWTPTPANIMALPRGAQDYIHHLETRADPAGDVRELAIARDTIRALEAQVAELKGERP